MAPAPPRCSVITAVHDCLDHTRLFLESLTAFTDRPHEVMVVDNGSAPAVTAHLRARPGVRLLRNEENLGVARAWNQGIRAATGEYLAICNNDVVLSPGWLGRLVGELESREHVGVVCATTNQVILYYYPDAFAEYVAHLRRAEGEVRVEPTWASVNAFYGGDYAGFAAEFGRRHAALRFPAFHAPCMVVRREVFEDVGLFDESLGLAFYEDIDFFARVMYNYRFHWLEVYGGVYVHHFRNATAAHTGGGALMAASHERFCRKWADITAHVLRSYPRLRGCRDIAEEYTGGRLTREDLLAMREIIISAPLPIPWGINTTGRPVGF